jgi:hypothetical protein
MSILMRADLRSSSSPELYFGSLGFFFHNQHRKHLKTDSRSDASLSLGRTKKDAWQDKKRRLGRIE